MVCSRKTEKQRENLEVATGLEPAKTGFADQRLGLFGITTSNFSIKLMGWQGA